MPWLLERKFGIRAFDYWWGYTSCEIELMVMDQPVISYGKSKNKRSMMASRKEVDELEQLQQKWEKKRNGRTFVGQKVDLGEFLNQKI